MTKEEKFQGNTTYPALVGNVLAQLRKEKGIGQAEFGALVGIGQSTWSRIEKGESALTIEQLAKAAFQLDLAPHEFLAVVDGARENLEDQGIGDLQDFAALLPSMNYVSLGPGTGNIYMRGISSGGESILGSNPNVSVYMDEQPVTAVGAFMNPHIYDIARI